MLDMPGFGAAPPLPAGVEPTAANLARGACTSSCAELGIERPHVAGNSLGGWVGAGDGARRLGRLGDGALPRRPLAGAARRAARGDATPLAPAGCGRCVSLGALRFPPLRRARCSPPSPPSPSGSPPTPGRELVLGWIDAERLRRRQPGDAHPRLRPGRLPRGRAGDDRLGRARPPASARRSPSAAPPAPASSSCPASATRRPGTTRSWSPAPCSGQRRRCGESGIPRHRRRSSDRRENREPDVAVERLPGRRRAGGTGVLIDGNDDLGPLLERAERDGIEITHILVTHPHPDHVAGLAEARRAARQPAAGRPRRGAPPRSTTRST